MANTKDRVAVVGGAGFIGSNLVDELVRLGYDVHVIDNLSGGKRENVNKKAKLHVVDIREPEPLEKALKGARYVFHLAALPRVQYSIENPRETHDVNVTGMLNVLIAAEKNKVKRVIYSASSSAYGDQKKMPLREDMPAAPVSPYGLHKYIGEVQCQVWSAVYGLSTVSLRYFNVYGPRLDPSGAYALVIGKFLKLRKEGNPLTVTGDGSQTRDFTHVSDVVRANILAMKSKNVGKGEVMNIGAGRNLSIKKLAELIGGEIKYLPARVETHDTLADNKLAKRLIGWTPTMTLEKGIALLLKEWGIRP